MHFDPATIANLGASGTMAVLFVFMIRWFLTQASKSMNRMSKSVTVNTLVLTELYKLNLVEGARARGVINGKAEVKDAAQQYRNLLESVKDIENQISKM